MTKNDQKSWFSEKSEFSEKMLFFFRKKWEFRLLNQFTPIKICYRKPLETVLSTHPGATVWNQLKFVMMVPCGFDQKSWKSMKIMIFQDFRHFSKVAPKYISLTLFDCLDANKTHSGSCTRLPATLLNDSRRLVMPERLQCVRVDQHGFFEISWKTAKFIKNQVFRKLSQVDQKCFSFTLFDYSDANKPHSGPHTRLPATLLNVSWCLFV